MARPLKPELHERCGCWRVGRRKEKRESIVQLKLKEKLLSRIEIVDGPLDTPCWKWMGAQNSQGRGHFTYCGKYYSTHRASWEVHHGPIPEGMFVCHRCDNGICCNPSHLFVGTCQDNTDDLYAKGYWLDQQGEANHNAKLTKDQVLQIKRLLASGNYSQQRIADAFGVSRETIRDIKFCRLWAWLTDDSDAPTSTAKLPLPKLSQPFLRRDW